jgi:hypothetical protein
MIQVGVPLRLAERAGEGGDLIGPMRLAHEKAGRW